MARAVIVVDMQNGFMTPGGTLYCGDGRPRDHRPPAGPRRTGKSRRGCPLLHPGHPRARRRRVFDVPPHCVEGSGEEEIIPELADLAAGARIVRKRRYSAFFETDLAAQLQELQPVEVVVMGDCTDICVLHTVSGLRNRDYRVEVPADCVASFDPEQHEWALGHMEKILGARITNRG